MSFFPDYKRNLTLVMQVWLWGAHRRGALHPLSAGAAATSRNVGLLALIPKDILKYFIILFSYNYL